MASSVLQEAQSQGDSQQLASLYGQNNLQSDFDWINLILNSIPAVSGSNTSSIVRVTLLPIKQIIFSSIATTVSVTYSFTAPEKGFEIVGQSSGGNNEITVSHIIVYDSQNVPHDFIIGGAAQIEVESMIASIKLQ